MATKRRLTLLTGFKGKKARGDPPDPKLTKLEHFTLDNSSLRLPEPTSLLQLALEYPGITPTGPDPDKIQRLRLLISDLQQWVRLQKARREIGIMNKCKHHQPDPCSLRCILPIKGDLDQLFHGPPKTSSSGAPPGPISPPSSAQPGLHPLLAHFPHWNPPMSYPTEDVTVDIPIFSTEMPKLDQHVQKATVTTLSNHNTKWTLFTTGITLMAIATRDPTMPTTAQRIPEGCPYMTSPSGNTWVKIGNQPRCLRKVTSASLTIPIVEDMVDDLVAILKTATTQETSILGLIWQISPVNLSIMAQFTVRPNNLAA